MFLLITDFLNCHMSHKRHINNNMHMIKKKTNYSLIWKKHREILNVKHKDTYFV